MTAADPTPRTLLVKSGGAAALADWQRHFHEVAPHLDVRAWDDVWVPPERVDYALVWQPEAGWLATYPKRRMVLSTGAGVDHITSDPRWPRHLPLVRAATPDGAQRMGEYVCMAALALLRDLKRSVRQQQAGDWTVYEVDRTAHDTRVGFLGLGTMGLQAATMVRALGFQTLGWSRSPKALTDIECQAGDDALPGFLARCDILVCLLPATVETDGILTAARLALLPRGATLVHVGRGSHLRYADLAATLDAGHLGGAFVDVFEDEPLPADHPAWRHEKIFVTPHVAAIASKRMRARFFAAQIAAFEQGRVPEGLYDLEQGY